MCTDCHDIPRPPDIVVRRDSGSGEFLFQPLSAAADAFLARKFAQVEGDLTNQDATRIVTQARLLGFVVEVLA
jgi:hypothetical protein